MAQKPARCPWRAGGRFVRRVAAALLIAVAAAPANAGLEGVLDAKDLEAKTQIIIKNRRGVSPQDVLLLVQRERDDSLVALAAGIYFETSADDAKEAAAVAATAAARRGMFSRIATMVAQCPNMADIVAAYVDGGRMDNVKTRRFAAEVLAAYAVMVVAPDAALGPPKQVQPQNGPPANNPRKPNANRKRRGAGRAVGMQARLIRQAQALKPQITATLAKLLEENDGETVELAVLAAAYLECDGVAEKIAAIKPGRWPAVDAVSLLYLARLGKPLPDDVVQRLFTQRLPVARPFAKVTPLMTTYDMGDAPLAYVCEAIGQTGKSIYLQQLHHLLESDRDLRVQAAAARAVEAIADPASLPVLHKVLKKCDWPVLVPVCSALGAIPSVDSIPPLIERLDAETGRFRLDCNYALASIAGQQRGQTGRDWNIWWNEAKATFKVDPKMTAEFRRTHRVQDMYAHQLGNFYGLSIYSDRFVYVLDTSASMRGQKIKDLMENLNMSLRGLDPKVRFNVVDFGGQINVMFGPTLVPAAAAKASALQQLEYMSLTLGTRSYDGMEVGMMIHDVDTIIYLSDGAPVAGQFGKWPTIIHAMDVINRHRPIAIYTVEFNAGPANAASMGELSGRNAALSTSPNAN
jgi:HEAT repeats